MENGSELAEIVRALRAQLGLTKERFSGKFDVAFAIINQWKNGHFTPSRAARNQIVSPVESIEPNRGELLVKFRRACPQ